MAIKKALKKKETPQTNVEVNKSGETTLIKEAQPLEHTDKHNIDKTLNNNPRTAGVNIGITKNMGDYESLRIDCWITDELAEGETHAECLARLGEIATKEVERQLEELA